jgi:hypothetical protein
MNKTILNQKYRALIPHNVERFVQGVNELKKKVDLKSIDGYTALIYSDGLRESIQYTLCVYNALKQDRLLEYASVTALAIGELHFSSSEDKDKELVNELQYTDILFIKLSQFENTTSYIENLVIDLIETRTDRKKLTYIIYDVMGAKSNHSLTVRSLHKYYVARGYTVLNLSNGKTLEDSFSTAKPTPSVNIVTDASEEPTKGVVRRGGNK